MKQAGYLFSFLFALLLSVPSISLAQPDDGYYRCAIQLQRHRYLPPAPTGKIGEIYRKFLASNRILFTDRQFDTFDTTPFVVSNEWDAFKAKRDYSRTDLVIGFGTNIGWDIAVQKGASELVIGDISGRPLFGQEFIMRPLLLIARSRADFFAMLTGTNLPSSYDTAALEDSFKEIDSQLDSFYQSQNFSKRARNYARVQERLAQDPRVTADQQIVLSTFFSVLTRSYQETSEYVFFEGTFINLRERMPDQIYMYLQERYQAHQIPTNGGANTEDQIHHPYFSAFASEDAFSRLKHLFDGHVHYVASGYDTLDMYSAVHAFGARRGAASYTLSLTNILDVLYPNHEMANADALQGLLRQVFPLLASEKHPLTVFRTRGTHSEHMFEHHRLGSFNDIDNLQTVANPNPIRQPNRSAFDLLQMFFNGGQAQVVFMRPGPSR